MWQFKNKCIYVKEKFVKHNKSTNILRLNDASSQQHYFKPTFSSHFNQPIKNIIYYYYYYKKQRHKFQKCHKKQRD